MAFSVNRVANITGAVVGEIAFTRNPHEPTPQLLSVIAKPPGRTYSYWDLLPDGSLFETPVLTKNGGEHDLGIAAYNHQRVVTMGRSGSNAPLNFAAWKTAGFFELSDEHAWTNDQDPVILPFGANPPSSAQLGSGPIGPGLTQMAGKSGSGSTRPGTTPGTNPGSAGGPPGPVKPVGGLGASFGPKAGRAVVASRTADGLLRLSLWMFDNGGDVKLKVSQGVEVISSFATKVTLIKLREFWSVDNKRVTGLEVVAVLRANLARLRLERWKIDLGGQGTPASFQLIGEVTAPETIVTLSAATVDSLGGTQLVTPVRLFAGNVLKLIGWKMEANGAIARISDLDAGAVTAVASTKVRGRCFLTATRAINGPMKATYWLFPNTAAGAFEQKFETEESSIAENFTYLSCWHFPGAAQILGDTIVAARSPTHQLRLWRYQVSE